MALFSLAVTFMLSSTSVAELPMATFPECGIPYLPSVCPNDLQEEWWQISYIPHENLETVMASEVDGASGVSADLAWRLSTGSFSTLISVGDSGIQWEDTALTNKIYVNVGEVPYPQYYDSAGELVLGDSWDTDGNGLVNVQDWADDPRVHIDAGVDVADHMLDASDLIYTFSDGVDDDMNGYVDDISGWDFFGEDNDPWNTFNTGFGTHGTEVMVDGAAEGNDGDGKIGMCPNCAVLPVRLGDTFVVDGYRAAQGIAFAVDSGAQSMGLAVGAMSTPENMALAVEYAHEAGMSLVGAAGDENAYHHNFPAVLGDFLYVHSIHYDSGDRSDTYSFQNFFNCNNFGPRIDFVAPSPGCATGSVAIINGLSGLIHSYSDELGLGLDVDERRQIIRATVDDIWLTSEESDAAKTYPSNEGWDAFYGYGRVNAGRALAQMEAGEIPPVARFGGPEWFTLYNQEPNLTVPVELWMRAERSSGYSWVLEWGAGADPEDWTTVESGSEVDSADGFVVDVDLSSIHIPPVQEPPMYESVPERLERTHTPAVTFRLRVIDNEQLMGEARRTIYVNNDNGYKAGFPIRLQGSGESSPVLTDINGDGVFEIVAGDSSGAVHVYDGHGEELEGWPAWTDTMASSELHSAAQSFSDGWLDLDAREPIISSVAVADVTGDGIVNIVVAGAFGQIYMYDATGEMMSGFPVSIIGREPWEFDTEHTYDNAIMGAPTIYDIDFDGTGEIIVAGMDSRLYVWEHDGAPFDGYPIEVCHEQNCGVSGNKLINSVAVGDVDGDGSVDFLLGSNETVNDGGYTVTHALNALTGLPLPGWPLEGRGLINASASLPTIGEGHPASVALADLDDDGDLEIVDVVMLGQNDVLSHEGSVALDLDYNALGANSNSVEPSFVSMSNFPVVGDLNGDGVPDVVVGGAGTYAVLSLALSTEVDFHHVVGAWDGATGEVLDGWPRQVEDFAFMSAPTIADVSGDGIPEVIFGSAGSLLHAVDAEGNVPPGWPLFTGQWMMGAPAVGDIDGDGWLDVVVSTREGWMFAWGTNGRADQAVQWASLHHDPANTGNYETPLAAQEGPPEIATGCCKGGGNESQGLMLLPLLLIGLSRRDSL